MLFLTIHQVQNYTFFLIYANVYGTFFMFFLARYKNNAYLCIVNSLYYIKNIKI